MDSGGEQEKEDMLELAPALITKHRWLVWASRRAPG